MHRNILNPPKKEVLRPLTANEEMARLLPRVEINWEAIQNTWSALERISHCDRCRADGTALVMYLSARTVQSTQLMIENSRLIEETAKARENSANLLAAIRAALAAAADGEDDPLWYLRDEYAEHGNLSPREEGRRCV